MAEYSGINRDNVSDRKSDTRDTIGDESKNDYGGDLAKDTGVDLNAGADVSGNSKIEKPQDSQGEDLNNSRMDASA